MFGAGPPGEALGLLLNGDSTLLQIIALSLFVTLTAIIVAAAIGVLLGACLGLARFPGSLPW